MILRDVLGFSLVFAGVLVGDVWGKTIFPVNFNAFFEKFVKKESLRPDLKEYSGKRTHNESVRMVYLHDQTVAIAELGPSKQLLSCEFIEIYEPDEVNKVLGDDLKGSNVIMISFREMLKLMSQCWKLENFYLNATNVSSSEKEGQIFSRGLLPSNPFALFSGIIPGTKWCGTGDIAQSYYDLGSEVSTDRCCRAHDLCPVKIRAYSSKYNLTNDSLYTKSHCNCDDVLFSCLKQADSPSANLLGNIYFNLVQVPCINETTEGREFSKEKKNF